MYILFPKIVFFPLFLLNIYFMSNKKDKERNKILDEFDMIQDYQNDFDVTAHLAKTEDLPDLGSIEIYDYESDLTVATQKGSEVLESLVDLFLGDFPELKDHPYIRNKVKEDALVYAESLFLQKMTRRNFMTQLRQIDNGDNSARMHEVVNQTISQIRENSKFASTQRTDLEKFYKDFRNDVMEVMEKSIDKYSGSKKQKKDSEVINSAKLNDLINEALKKDKKDPI
jgi:hypothetical protein